MSAQGETEGRAGRHDCHRGQGMKVHRWPKSLLTWHADPANGALFAAASTGIERWRPFIPVDFKFVGDPKKADLVCSIGQIDGKGRKLAHAYRHEGMNHPLEGDVIFDEADFKRLSHEGRIEVLAHEFGHALGLGHNRRASLMFPRFTGPNNAGMLWKTDIAGIQKLYGKRKRR